MFGFYEQKVVLCQIDDMKNQCAHICLSRKLNQTQPPKYEISTLVWSSDRESPFGALQGCLLGNLQVSLLFGLLVGLLKRFSMSSFKKEKKRNWEGLGPSAPSPLSLPTYLICSLRSQLTLISSSLRSHLKFSLIFQTNLKFW